MNVKVINENRYLEGFVGDTQMERKWIEEKKENLITTVEAVAEVLSYVPQLAYACIQRAFQQEWSFIQRVVPNIDTYFKHFESSIQSKFFLKLYLEKP